MTAKGVEVSIKACSLGIDILTIESFGMGLVVEKLIVRMKPEFIEATFLYELGVKMLLGVFGCTVALFEVSI